MRTELWGLRNKETNELVLEYWASSQKHKALFSSYDRAQKACSWKHNMHLEPFKIEPVVHGKWIIRVDDGDLFNHVHCTNCDFYWSNERHAKIFKYCPNCGAKMNGEAR